MWPLPPAHDSICESSGWGRGYHGPTTNGRRLWGVSSPNAANFTIDGCVLWVVAGGWCEGCFGWPPQSECGRHGIRRCIFLPTQNASSAAGQCPPPPCTTAARERRHMVMEKAWADRVQGMRGGGVGLAGASRRRGADATAPQVPATHSPFQQTSFRHHARWRSTQH